MPLHEQKIFARYNRGNAMRPLSELAIRLLELQKMSWPQLTEGYEALNAIRVRELACEGFFVRLQFNPRRLVSSSAKIDDQSIRNRRCFLCMENLPAQQIGILYEEQFLVLCNPAPIFKHHYTISHVQHVPQAVMQQVAALLQLAKDFSPHFTVFYNGPKCGASAPDHLHFQASPAGAIPVENEAPAASRRHLIQKSGEVAFFRLHNFGREVFLLEGNECEALAAALAKFFHALQAEASTQEEPMMNVLCSFQEGTWRIMIFPRRKHRPRVYFCEGDERILISPASVDMGGLIILPVEEDFLKVESRLIADIYREVSIDGTHADHVVELLRRS